MYVVLDVCLQTYLNTSVSWFLLLKAMFKKNPDFKPFMSFTCKLQARCFMLSCDSTYNVHRNRPYMYIMRLEFFKCFHMKKQITVSLIIWTYNFSSPVSERYSTHVICFFSEGYFLQTRGIHISSHTGLQTPTNNDFPRELTFLIIFLHPVIDR